MADQDQRNAHGGDFVLFSGTVAACFCGMLSKKALKKDNGFSLLGGVCGSAHMQSIRSEPDPKHTSSTVDGRHE